MTDYVYFVSSYKAWSDYSEVEFTFGNLRDAVEAVEANECDWIECYFTHAIIWRMPHGYTASCSMDVVGVYYQNECVWIDYDVVGELNERRLLFHGMELDISHNRRIGPRVCPGDYDKDPEILDILKEEGQESLFVLPDYPKPEDPDPAYNPFWEMLGIKDGTGNED